EVNQLFSKLYNVLEPADHEGYMSPSQDLKNALSPEFKIFKVKREFIGRSACGSLATSVMPPDLTASRHKEKIVFSNRLNRLGPFKVGSPFKFQIPKDTVYSVNRQVDTRDMILSLAPLDQADQEIPDWIFF